MTNTILILENDSSLATSLSELFQTQGWHTDQAESLARGYQLLANHTYEVVVLDRMLDDGDGLEIVSYLKEMHPLVRSLCLTKQGQVTERIQGLRQGADDYLAKPFATQELLLRVQRLLDNHHELPEKKYLHRSFEFKPERGHIVADGTIKHLRKREAQILEVLLRYKNQVVSRDMLLEYVWPGESETPLNSTLDVYIRRLRMRLGTAGVIKTMRGFGYMLMP